MMVAVTTLREAGGAEVAREALADRGIPVEIKRHTNFTLYFGAPAGEEFEVRVPEEHLEEAQRVLEIVTAELERRAFAEAGVPPEDEAPDADELPPPESRPRKILWAVAIGLISPVPGCGLLYARAFQLGYLFIGLSVALWFGGLVVGNPDAVLLGFLLKPVDVILAPVFAARFNRELERLQDEREAHAARS